MEKIRIGVVGAGAIAQTGHLPYYAKHHSVEIAALADLSIGRASDVAEQFGIDKVYDDVEEMIKNEALDGISICTSNDSHYPIAMSALKQGVDVLIEKPLALTYDQALTIAQEVRKCNRIALIGMVHRFRNATRAMKKLIDSGRLGELYYAKARLLRRRGTPTGWFTSKSRAGGGTLMDIGVHALDLAWWLAGKPEINSITGHLFQGLGNYQTQMQGTWISAEASNQERSIFDVEDFATANLRFKNGMVLQLEVSWAMHGKQDEGLHIDIYGTKGGLSLDPLCYYTEIDGLLVDSMLQVQNNDPLEEEINHFVQCIQNRKDPDVPIEDGVHVMQMLENIMQSTELRKEVTIK